MRPRLLLRHISTVYRIISKFKTTGSTERLPGQGRKRTARTAANIKAVRERIRRNPVRSMRKIARDLGVSDFTVRNIVKNNLHAKSRARTSKQLISASSQAKRLARCKQLLSKLKKGMAVIIFTDEKVFTIDSVSNSRTNRYISPKPVKEVPDSIKHVFKTKHPASVMVFGLVASDGKKMPPVFIPNGVKINSDEYIRILESHVKPWIISNYSPDVKVVFQQDGAPAHTSKKTQSWLSKNMPNFWSKELWPPNSPDLNPLDFSVWANVEAKACAKPHANVEALKTSITKAWMAMTPEYIKTTCSKFRSRIEAVIASNGTHFE